MRSKTLGAILIALSALAVGAAPAGAVVANTAGGRVGYLPLNGSPASAAAPKGFTEPTGEPPLLYHGGPVMHSQAAYAIFWEPSGYTFPTGYKTAIEDFLKNVAADSNKSTNVYSVSAQYTDGTGHAAYSDTFGGSVTDTTAFPTSGTCDPYSGVGETFTACVTDAKLEAEVDSVVTAQAWPHGLGDEFYMVLPPHAGSCFDDENEECFDEVFCAYHSYSLGTGAIYSNISYSPGDVLGCGVGEYPNGFGTKGNVDDTLSSLSHEANESITDPKLNAWFDFEGLENGDECRNSNDDFGSPLGGSSGTLFNQAIGSAHYYLQQEWSNDIEDCAQRVEPAAVPTIVGPGKATPGQTVFFDGSGSLPGATEIVSFDWNFGDGSTASGETAFHAFATPGVFTVSLTLEDEWGLIYSATHKVTVSNSEVIVEELPPGTIEEARRKIEEANTPVTPQLPSAPPACKVPKLAGLTLAKAKAALAAAGCKLGRVAQPKAKKGGKAPALVVKSSSPAVGAKPAGGTVNLTLGPKPKPKKHHHAH